MATTDESQEQGRWSAGKNAEAFGVDDNLVKASFRLRIELNRIEQREPRSWTNAAEVPYGLVG